MAMPVTPDRTLGVLGGMGPAASAEFLRELACQVNADRDPDHPRVIMLSDPSVPERTASVLTGTDAPLLPIRNGLQTLVSWGADVLVVPCNTAHVFIDRFRDELPIPLVHIVETTLDEATSRSTTGWLAATTGTVKAGSYQRLAARRGYRLLVPDAATQAEIHQTSALVKANRTAQAGAVLAGVAQRLQTLHDVPLIAACTELPLAWSAAGLPAERAVSSLSALAAGCLRELAGPREISLSRAGA